MGFKKTSKEAPKQRLNRKLWAETALTIPLWLQIKPPNAVQACVNYQGQCLRMCMQLFSAPTCWSCRRVWHMLVLKSSCLCSWLTCSCQWHEPSAKDSSEAQRRFSCRRVPPCWLAEWFKLLDCCCCLAFVLLWRAGFPLPSPEKAAGGFRLLRTEKVNTLFKKTDYRH